MDVINEIARNSAFYEKNIYNNFMSGSVHNEKPDSSLAKESLQKDFVEISDVAYRMQKYDIFTTDCEDRKMYAKSGNDILGISKGDLPYEFVIHFDDSAMVNRAVSRGFITVNGVDIMLSDNDKETMLKIDRDAEQKRRSSFESYVMEHEAAVEKQQGEALAKAYEDMQNTLKIFFEPDREVKSSEAPEGVIWSDFDWKTYDTSMKVSMLDEPSIGEIYIREHDARH